MLNLAPPAREASQWFANHLMHYKQLLPAACREEHDLIFEMDGPMACWSLYVTTHRLVEISLVRLNLLPINGTYIYISQVSWLLLNISFICCSLLCNNQVSAD